MRGGEGRVERGKEGGEGEGGREDRGEGEQGTVVNADFLKTGNILLQVTELETRLVLYQILPFH